MFNLEVNMTTLTQAFVPNLARINFIKKRDEIIEKLIPRPCMIVSVGLIIAGLCIPFLMAIELFPVGLLSGFIGFALFMTGGILTLVYCGEI
jgi:hypothetical protein